MIDTLYVLYDSRCGLCSRVREWMLEQPAHVALDFVAAGSDRARRLFPDLDHDEAPNELVVVTSEGEVYEDDAAWIVCLWALRDLRPWSQRFARGPLRPLARAAWHFLSSNRNKVGALLALQSDAEIARTLRTQPPPTCDVAPTSEWRIQ
jgi:predicted DCC family thiol-disulfide oxidoreductase YuxK